MKKRFLVLFLTIAVVVLLVPFQAFALSPSCGGITVSVSGQSSLKGDDSTIIVTRNNAYAVSKTATITIKNSGSEKAEVQFDYEKTGKGTLKIAGSEPTSDSGTFRIPLERDATVEVTLTLDVRVFNSYTGQVTLKNFSRTEFSDAASATFLYDENKGTVKVFLWETDSRRGKGKGCNSCKKLGFIK